MGIRITHNAFHSPSEADAGVAQAGLVRMELDVEPVDNSAHWHDFHAELYVLAGELHFTDVAEGKTHVCSAGTKIVVPRGALHAELSRAGYRIIFGTSVPPERFTQPVNRPPELLPVE